MILFVVRLEEGGEVPADSMVGAGEGTRGWLATKISQSYSPSGGAEAGQKGQQMITLIL